MLCLNEFQKYYHDLGHFFDIWDKFKSPNGTKKASFAEEKELYQLIRGTEMEARFPLWIYMAYYICLFLLRNMS